MKTLRDEVQQLKDNRDKLLSEAEKQVAECENELTDRQRLETDLVAQIDSIHKIEAELSVQGPVSIDVDTVDNQLHKYYDMRHNLLNTVEAIQQQITQHTTCYQHEAIPLQLAEKMQQFSVLKDSIAVSI